MTPQQVIDAWNAQADEYNQWCELDDNEKIEWTLKCGEQPAQEPMRSEAIYEICRRTLQKTVAGLSFVPEWALPLARAIERAHGIAPDKSDCHGPDWTERDGEFLK